MKVCRRPDQEGSFLEILHHKFREVKEFKYLGTVITHDNIEEVEFQYRLPAADRTY